MKAKLQEKITEAKFELAKAKNDEILSVHWRAILMTLLTVYQMLEEDDE